MWLVVGMFSRCARVMSVVWCVVLCCVMLCCVVLCCVVLCCVVLCCVVLCCVAILTCLCAHTLAGECGADLPVDWQLGVVFTVLPQHKNQVCVLLFCATLNVFRFRVGIAL